MEQSPQCLMVPLERVSPMAGQPRETFDPVALEELAQSLREHGLIEPLVVRLHGGAYEIIAGERRWRAAQRAHLSEVPVVVREATDSEALELALVENIQRETLNDIEFAKALLRLQDGYGYTQEALSLKLGKDRSTIANTLRLLRLPEKTQRLIVDGLISAGHGRALLKLADNPAALAAVQALVLKDQLGVAATEALVRRRKHTYQGNTYLAAVEDITKMATEAAAAGIDMYEALGQIERSDVWRSGKHQNFGEFLAKNWPNSLGLHRYNAVIGAIGVYGSKLIRSVGAEAAHCMLDPVVVESDEKRRAVVTDLEHHIRKYGAAPQVAEVRRLVRHHAGEAQTSNVADRAEAARERDTELLRLRQELATARKDAERLKGQIVRLTAELTEMKEKNRDLLRRNADLSRQIHEPREGS